MTSLEAIIREVRRRELIEIGKLPELDIHEAAERAGALRSNPRVPRRLYHAVAALKAIAEETGQAPTNGDLREFWAVLRDIRL